MTKELERARAMLVRGLENYERYDRNTYGRRDAINRDIPNAIEAMVDAKLAAALAARVAAEAAP